MIRKVTTFFSTPLRIPTEGYGAFANGVVSVMTVVHYYQWDNRYGAREDRVFTIQARDEEVALAFMAWAMLVHRPPPMSVTRVKCPNRGNSSVFYQLGGRCPACLLGIPTHIQLSPPVSTIYYLSC